ncbi:PREDICTED: uncharacterized protein LOC108549974 [Eufriesea mexicana]|uniref:uncharacterized protein LOC108549974 n=1 Tax=Eufriesea mexicana TaxID=516756 RepID=UPI00083BE9DE|nr:PREDICTED: uncharacterized protein LOC108549974 [Eufriesea mexicana]
MKTELLLQLNLLLTVLMVTMSEGSFFEYPKRVLMDFLQTLKEKREAKKKPYIDHYHFHYYPVAYIYEPTLKALGKHELEEVHNNYLTSLGWSNHEYKYVPEPKVKIPLNLYDSWKDLHENLEAELLETVVRNEDDGIYVELPLNQKIIIEHPNTDEKLKYSLLAKFRQKILDSKNSLYSNTEKEID